MTKDDEIVVIESVKAASDILAPLDGEITERGEGYRGATEWTPGMTGTKDASLFGDLVLEKSVK